MMVRLFRNGLGVLWLCALLAGTTVSAGVWALQLTGQVALLSAQTATLAAQKAKMALQHRQAMSRALARSKARARVRRMIVAVPVAGLAAAAAFEEQDYREWLESHPDGTRAQYGCETAHLTAEVIADELAALPEAVRPDPASLKSGLPVCTH